MDGSRQAGLIGEGPQPSKSSNWCAILSVISVAWAAVLFGMTLGFTSPAIDVMQNTVQVDGAWVQSPSNLVVFDSDTKVSAQGALFGSLVNIGALIGALMGGSLMEFFGRRLTIIAIAPVLAVSWLIIGLANNFALFLVCRFVGGIGVGVTSCVVPTYINEVAPTNLRGAFGTVFQLGVVVGIMLVNLLGAFVFRESFAGHEFCQWRFLAYSFCVPSAILFFSAMVVPETPAWLASKGRMVHAKASLAKLRGGQNSSEAEFEQLQAASSDTGVQAGGFKDLLQNRRVVSIGLTLMLIQQFSGINVIIFFQTTIFEDAGVHNADALGFWVMVLQVVMTAVAVPLMDTAGRKALLMLASSGMMVCCVCLTIFYIHKSPSWLVLVASFAYISFFSLGLGPIPWLMQGELFPQHFRSLATSCAVGLNWLCSFIVTETVSDMKVALTFTGVFAVYGCVLCLGLIFIICMVPETKGKNFEELAALLNIRTREVSLVNPVN